MSHGWKQAAGPLYSDPLTSRYIQYQQLGFSGKLSFLICYDPLPLSIFFLNSPLPFPSLLSLSRSLSVSPHPSPPLLRVSGRLFFLCLSLMKGRTKLPSLCPCVVGKFTSLVHVVFLLPSVCCCLCFCMLAQSLLVILAGLGGGLHVHLCVLHRTCLKCPV